jgi:uncharacterized membrane protein
MTLLLPIHIVAGGLAIVLGAAALLARKGATVHRRVGLVFVYAMLTMGLSGSVMALRQSLTNSNGLGGLTVIYFVVTALLTVRPPAPWTRPVTMAAAALAGILAVIEIGLGVKAYNNPGGMLNGAPFFMLFFLAAVTGLGAIGDVRLLDGTRLQGGARLSRHLWRMCFALFIATASFFSIRARVAKILPEPFTTPPMRTLPILLVFAAMFYWLWRVRSRRPTNSPRDAVLRAQLRPPA